MKRNDFLKIILGIPLLFTKLPVQAKNLGKTIFTPEMLSRNNYGLFIINVKAGDVINSKNIGYCANVAWKLTWQMKYFKNPVSKNVKEQVFEFPKYSKTNVFTDGWVHPIGDSYEEVCEWLNNNPHGQEFRLMTKEEVVFLINNRKQGFLE